MSKKESIKIYETVNSQSYIGHINFNPPTPFFPLPYVHPYCNSCWRRFWNAPYDVLSLCRPFLLSLTYTTTHLFTLKHHDKFHNLTVQTMTLRLNRLKRLLHSPTMVYSVGIHIRQDHISQFSNHE